MKKLLFFLSFIILTDLFSFIYLKQLMDKRTAFSFESHTKPLIYQKRDIVLKDVDDFVFEDYFSVLSAGSITISYKTDGDQIKVFMDEEEYEFPYEIIPPEVITVEKIVYKEKEVIKETVTEGNRNENGTVSYETEADYFYLKNQSLSFEKGTDISVIIREITDSVDTNQDVSVDYSQLNPNQTGTDQVFFITKSQKYDIFVNIF